MIIDFLVIFILLTLTGFPVIHLLFPKTTSVFKVSSAAYLGSFILIISTSLILRLGWNMNYGTILFILISLIAWSFTYKSIFKKFLIIFHKTNVKAIAVIFYILFISSSILFYPSIKGAYALFHMGPDFYGYGMSASYLQEHNNLSELRQTIASVASHHGANIWSLGDLREAVSLDFIINSNRYGLQSLAAVLDNVILHSNSAAELLYPLLVIAITATLGGFYQLLIQHKIKIIYILCFLAIICFNTTQLVAIIEGHLGLVFTIAAPLLLCIVLASLMEPKNGKKFAWPEIFALVIVLTGSLIAYQEVIEFYFLLLFSILIFFIVTRDKKNIMNLLIAGILFVLINIDVLITFATILYERFHQHFAGASINVGFLDFFSGIGLTQAYQIVPHTITPFPQNDFLINTTIIIYLLLFFSTLLYYKSRKISGKIAVIIFIGIFVFSMLATIFILKSQSNFIIWNLTYVFLPFIILALIFLGVQVKYYFAILLRKLFPKIKLEFVTNKIFLIGSYTITMIVIINFFTLYKDYMHNSFLLYVDESKAFEKGTYSDKILLTMSENQLYYLPGFHGKLYWLNSGWMPVFGNAMRSQKVTLVIFKQLENDGFFNNARHYFGKNMLYANDQVIIAQLNEPASGFLTKANNTNRDFMHKYLDNLRNRINTVPIKNEKGT